MKKIIMTMALIAAYPWAPIRAEKRVNFDEFIKEALIASPEAARIDATLAERVAEAFSVRVKENPVLSGGVELPRHPPEGEHVEMLVLLSQAIRPSDFGDRSALASVIEETASVEKILALNEFIQNVGVLYARAWQFQETEGLLADSRKRASQILQKVSEGASRGIFSQGDVELLKAEQKSFEADAIAARSDLARTKAELIRLTSLSLQDNVFIKPDDTLPFTRDSVAQLVRESKLPLQQRYLLLTKLANKQLEVARLDSFPVISPALGYGRHDDGTNQVTIGVSVPLPFFNRNQADKIKSQGALAAAERGQSYATSEAIVGEITLLYDALISVKKQVDIYETGVVPAQRRALEAYYRQFDAGVGTTFQLWQAQRELNNSRLRALELRSNLSAARAQINALLGQQF